MHVFRFLNETFSAMTTFNISNFNSKVYLNACCLNAKRLFLNENRCIVIPISLRCVPNGRIRNNPALS